MARHCWIESDSDATALARLVLAGEADEADFRAAASHYLLERLRVDQEALRSVGAPPEDAELLDSVRFALCDACLGYAGSVLDLGAVAQGRSLTGWGRQLGRVVARRAAARLSRRRSRLAPLRDAALVAASFPDWRRSWDFSHPLGSYAGQRERAEAICEWHALPPPPVLTGGREWRERRRVARDGLAGPAQAAQAARRLGWLDEAWPGTEALDPRSLCVVACASLPPTHLVPAARLLLVSGAARRLGGQGAEELVGAWAAALRSAGAISEHRGFRAVCAGIGDPEEVAVALQSAYVGCALAA